MKKKLLILFFALMFVSLSSVKAGTCSDARTLELSSLANNVNVGMEKELRVADEYTTYETGEKYQDTYPAFYITVYNLTKDLNVSITREETKKTGYLSYKDIDEDGVLYVDAGYADAVKTFTVKIRSNDSNCKNEVLKTVTVTTPMYNLNSQFDACQDNMDFNMCKEFTTVDYSNITQDQFHEELEKFKEEKAKEEKRANSIFNKIAKFISKYRWIFITVIIVAIAFAVVYIINRKKSRLV